MKIGFYNDFQPCIVKDDGVVDISDAVGHLSISSPQRYMERIIANFGELRGALDAAESGGAVIPMSDVQLRAPVPRPGKVLCGNANYMEGVPIDPPRPLKTFFKSPDAVIGPDDTIELPAYNPVIFNHEAELAVVIGKTAHNVSEDEALDYVFGYMTAVDVSARAPEAGESQLPGDYGKSFDTFLPIGPAITTADEIADPNNLNVRYWVNEELRQNYNTSDMEHSIKYVIAALSHVMSLKPGDVILAGTNHSGLGPLQDGDFAEIEIDGLGRQGQHVSDQYGRSWDPQEVRQPHEMAARRESLKEQPNNGTWPFQPRGG